MKEFLENIPEFDCVNYFAVEVLESAGFVDPDQEAIDTVERILQDDSIGVDSYSPIQYLIHQTQYKGRVLLLHNNPLVLKVQYILLSNYGFLVDAAETFKEFEYAFRQAQWSYHIIGLCHKYYFLKGLRM